MANVHCPVATLLRFTAMELCRQQSPAALKAEAGCAAFATGLSAGERAEPATDVAVADGGLRASP
jgi:hypothetical protein